MTETDYFALIAACDKLLRGASSTYERIAVSWLHILNEHPSNLSRYRELLEPSRRIGAAKRNLRNLGGIGTTLARSLWYRYSDPAKWATVFPAQVDVLFLSHLVSAQADQNSADFYYGSLPEDLATHGISSLVVLQNQVADGEGNLSERVTRGGVTSRILLPRQCSLPIESHILHRARLIASTLRQEASADQSAFQRSVALEAARHATTGSTISSLRLHGEVKRLCARFRPRALIVLWEGHAAERLAFHAARAVDPGVQCVGYQHTILFPRAHALTRSLGRDYDPDVILTLGDVTRDVLRASPGLSGIPVVTYGSHRRAVAVERRSPDASTRCLVIPDGIEIECLTLFDFALTAAAHMPDTQFVLRMHPVLPFDWLARRYARFGNLPENVHVSYQADIWADFAKCDWALYRGSSAAVHAVLAGVRPVYVKCLGELSIDPLFALEGWRQYVNTVEEFGALVAADCAAASEDRRQEWEPARAFCDRYVVTPCPDVVRGLLTN